ncbi:hypothetical protein [Streptomyces sp. NBC_00470]|uniref:hypothetical protein n=1 Tax=Streptomyces sp. NBC_00470 TaxID=2975753 RepID=UPI003247C363
MTTPVSKEATTETAGTPEEAGSTTETVTAPETPKENSGRGEKTFSEKDLQRVRQEEKDKLYGRLNTMQEELETIRKERETAAEAQRRQQEETEAAANAKAEEEMSARDLLAKRQQEWEGRFEEMEKQRQADAALFEQERAFQQLQEYRRERLGAEADNIAPELLDFVQGDSAEEVDASIEMLKAKSQQIVSSLQEAQQEARSQMRGVSPNGGGVGPDPDQPGYQRVTAADIRNMSPSQWAKERHKYLNAAALEHGQRGMFH